MHSLLEAALRRVAGIRLRKTGAWNRGSTVPEDIEEISPEAWQTAGIKVLGTPIGTNPFGHRAACTCGAQDRKNATGQKKRKRDKISNLLSGQNKKLHPGQKKHKRDKKKRHLGQNKK